MKKILILFASLTVAISVFALSASAKTVFLKDDGRGDGKTEARAISTVEKAFEALGEDGGEIVICGKTTVKGDIVPAKYTGEVKITSVYDGVDYRKSGAELYFEGRYGLFLAGPSVIENCNINIPETAFIFAQWNPLEMGEGITVLQYKSGNGLYLIGGTQNKKEGEFTIRNGEPHITVRSGKYHTVTPYSRQIKATFTGDSVIDIYGGDIENVIGAPLGIGYVYADTLVNVYGGRIKTLCFFTEPGNNLSTLQGECSHTINVSGGEIQKIYADANNNYATFALNYTKDAPQNVVSLIAGEGSQRVAVCKKEDLSKTEISLQINSETGYIDGVEKILDASPMIRLGRTLLPVRFVAENLGATVGWDGKTSTVTLEKDDIKIEIVIGKEIAKVNGKEIKLDSPAIIHKDRSYLPVRFVAENLGAIVEWDGKTSTVTLLADIKKKETPKIEITPLEKKPASGEPLPKAPEGMRVISKADFLDKTTAGFISQLVGTLSGYEFKTLPSGRCQVAMPDEWFELCNGPYAGNDKYMHHLDKLLLNKETGILETWIDDDFSVDIFNQYMLEEMYASYGTVSAKVISDSWKKYGIWDMGGGQRQAGAYGVISRKNYLPQFAGSGEFGNWYSYLSEPYIATDTLGMNAAGMPETAISLANTFAQVTGDRDNVEWAKMYAAMFSMAYFENDIETLILEAAKVFPDGSSPMTIVNEVFALYKKYPSDWRKAISEFENNYYLEKYTNSANTPINCGFTLLIMLYGGGDYTETARIGSLAGYDCETTAGIALSVIGIINGMNVLPEEVNEKIWQNGRGVIVNLTRTSADEGIRMHADNLETRMPVADVVDRFVKNFESVLKENGGYMDEKYYYIPMQTIGTSDSVVIENGDFESGTLKGFVVKGGNAEITNAATTGIYATKISGKSDFSTTVKGLTAGKTYALTAYLNVTPASEAYLYAENECVSVYHPENLAYYEWQKSVKRVLVFTATASEMKIGVRFVPGASDDAQYIIADQFVMTRIEENEKENVEIKNKSANNLYKDAVILSVNADAKKEVYIKLSFANGDGKNVDAKISVNGKDYSVASFYATGKAPDGMVQTDYVYIPVAVQKGINTVSFTFTGKTIGIYDAATVAVSERW
nr:ADP-ribosylglycohydrolase family protein [Clostridia bacterium]